MQGFFLFLKLAYDIYRSVLHYTTAPVQPPSPTEASYWRGAESDTNVGVPKTNITQDLAFAKCQKQMRKVQIYDM